MHLVKASRVCVNPGEIRGYFFMIHLDKFAFFVLTCHDKDSII